MQKVLTKASGVWIIALFAIIKCFLISNGRVLCVVTHQAQDDPEKRADTAVNFLRQQEPLLHNKTDTNNTL